MEYVDPLEVFKGIMHTPLRSSKGLYDPLIRLNNKNFFKPKSGDLWTKFVVSRRFQPAIYTAFDEESESEVQIIKILQENQQIDFKNWLF